MTRNGKIARLPRPCRDELNRRLDNGEPAVRLVEWLNALPEVQKVLSDQFAGRPVSEQNLSDWKAGGYLEWQTRQEALAQARELAADAQELAESADGQLADHLATVLCARYALALKGWTGEATGEFSAKLRALRTLCQDIVELRRGDHSGARLKIEQERLEREREKTDEEVFETFRRWAGNPAVRDCLCDKWLSPEDRQRRVEEIFGIPHNSPGKSDAGVQAPDPQELEQLKSEETKRKLHELLGINGNPNEKLAANGDDGVSLKVNQAESNQIKPQNRPSAPAPASEPSPTAGAADNFGNPQEGQAP